MPLSPKFYALVANLNLALVNRVHDVVVGTEQHIKKVHNWEDDTGSLRASVTGYVVNYEPHNKHFGDENWRNAQAEGSHKYTHPPFFNGPENYAEYDPEYGAGEGANTIVGLVTAFVMYAGRVEEHGEVGGTFQNAFPYMEALARDAFSNVLHGADGELMLEQLFPDSTD